LEIIDCADWNDCEQRVIALAGENDRLNSGLGRGAYAPLLFRGQRESTWKLETTLDRYPNAPPAFTQYYRAISAVKPQVEAYTNNTWKIMEVPEFENTAHNSDAGFSLKNFPAYDYLAYLRHHGFPSPLLDWSKSWAIAAFFAFQHASDDDGQVAIFAYREYSGGGKVGSTTAPQIIVFGPYVRTHRRHFLQQCNYTMCCKFHLIQGPRGEWEFSPHEDVFRNSGDEQDTLWTFTIPKTERAQVLAQLDRYNLNAYSLMGSEESLMEMLATRELHRR
jgi:hypothetical protein